MVAATASQPAGFPPGLNNLLLFAASEIKAEEAWVTSGLN